MCKTNEPKKSDPGPVFIVSLLIASIPFMVLMGLGVNAWLSGAAFTASFFAVLIAALQATGR